MTQIIAVSGYPGSGKTLFCEILEAENIRMISMADILRSKFQESFDPSQENDSTQKSDALGRWVAEQREEKGSDVIANWTSNYVKRKVETNLVSIDGIRSDVDVFSEEFDEVQLVFIEACFEIRLERLRRRGRDGEEKFRDYDLMRRDEREKEWGLEEVRSQSDFIIKNEESVDDLRSKAQRVLKNCW